MTPSAMEPTSTNPVKSPSPDVSRPPFQRDDQAEAQTVRERSKGSNPSLTLTFAVFLLVASLLALHLCLDDPSLFLLFDHYDSTPTPDTTFRDSWILTPGNDTIHSARLEYQLIAPSNNNNREEAKKPIWTFVILHGLGDYKASESFRLRQTLIQLGPDLFGSMRFIIPSAGLLPITVFGGQLRSAWFDIKNWTDVHQQEDEAHMKQNVIALNQILQDNQLDLGRTIIGGFSQGAVMSLLLSLNLENPPAGVVMLSGYTPIPKEVKRIATTKKKAMAKTELIWLHGELDPYFSIGFARNGSNFLKNLAIFSNLSFHSVPSLDHNWSIFELKLLLNSLVHILPPPAP